MYDLKNYPGRLVTKMESAVCKTRSNGEVWGIYMLMVAMIALLAIWVTEPSEDTHYSALPSADETAINLQLHDHRLTQAVEREWKAIEGAKK